MEKRDGDLPANLWTTESDCRVGLHAQRGSYRFGRSGQSLSERLKPMMSTPYFGNIDSKRLARAYVALAFAQDVAKGYVSEHTSLHPVLTALDMSAKLIEEILEDVLPEGEEEVEPQITQIM